MALSVVNGEDNPDAIKGARKAVFTDKILRIIFEDELEMKVRKCETDNKNILVIAEK